MVPAGALCRGTAPARGRATVRRLKSAGSAPHCATIRHKSVPLKFQDSPSAQTYAQPNRAQQTDKRTRDLPSVISKEVEGVAATDPSVLEYIPSLRRYARALTGDPSDADDLVQECLSRALARRQKRADIRNLRAYLFTILHNAHVDRLNERRRWSYSLAEDFFETRLARPAPQPDRLALRDLAEALEKLPEEQRQTVLLVGYEGMAYKDAAAVLEVPIGTVMSRLSRGREALRRMMNGAPMANLRKVQ